MLYRININNSKYLNNCKNTCIVLSICLYLYRTIKANDMKAIIEKNKTYKVTGERGDFTICQDSKGKAKMFQTSKVEIVEIDEMPREKKYRGYKAPVSEKARANAAKRYAAHQADLAEADRLDKELN